MTRLPVAACGYTQARRQELAARSNARGRRIKPDRRGNGWGPRAVNSARVAPSSTWRRGQPQPGRADTNGNGRNAANIAPGYREQPRLAAEPGGKRANQARRSRSSTSSVAVAGLHPGSRLGCRGDSRQQIDQTIDRKIRLRQTSTAAKAAGAPLPASGAAAPRKIGLHAGAVDQRRADHDQARCRPRRAAATATPVRSPAWRGRRRPPEVARVIGRERPARCGGVAHRLDRADQAPAGARRARCAHGAPVSAATAVGPRRASRESGPAWRASREMGSQVSTPRNASDQSVAGPTSPSNNRFAAPAGARRAVAGRRPPLGAASAGHSARVGESSRTGDQMRAELG